MTHSQIHKYLNFSVCLKMKIFLSDLGKMCFFNPISHCDF